MHPISRFERKASAAKKDRYDWLLGNEDKAREVRKAAQERASRVWRKRAKQALEEQEAYNELSAHLRAGDID